MIHIIKSEPEPEPEQPRMTSDKPLEQPLSFTEHHQEAQKTSDDVLMGFRLIMTGIPNILRDNCRPSVILCVSSRGCSVNVRYPCHLLPLPWGVAPGDPRKASLPPSSEDHLRMLGNPAILLRG